MSRCTIIAEAGVNHDGKLDKALKLCDAAKEAGADVVKFQTFVPYLSIRRDSKDYDTLAALALSFSDMLTIALYCADIGIEFCSTPDDLDSLKFLVEECGVERIKIGSGSLLYEPLVNAAFDTGLPVLLSTGMATLREIEWQIGMQRARLAHDAKTLNHLTLMHCVSLYPCHLKLANVRVVQAFEVVGHLAWTRELFSVGYSDHTIGIAAAQAAVALGATVIEKHFTLDPKAPGPDHAMSLYADALPFFVDCIRKTEAALGDGRKEPSPEEAAMIPRIRKDADGFQPGL